MEGTEVTTITPALFPTSKGESFEPVSNFNPSPRYYKLGKDGEKIPIKRSEYKKAMHDTFTVKHPLIPMCGHGLVRGHEPRHRNCEACWFAFFQVHGELTQSADEVFSKFGIAGVQQLRGPKFAKNFTKFMSTLAAWKKATEAAKAPGKEQNEQSISGPSSDSGTEADYSCTAEYIANEKALYGR